MNQTARIEMWTCLAREAAEIAKAFAHPQTRRDPSLELRMASARGQLRGLDPTRLPFPAWNEGKAFLYSFGRLVDSAVSIEGRLKHVDHVIGDATCLVEILATSAHRPRADLDD